METIYQQHYDLKKRYQALLLKHETMQRQYEEKLKQLRHELLNPKIKYVKTSEDWELVLREICQVYETSPSEVLGTSRKADFTIPRHLFCYIMRFHYGYKTTQIGRILVKDHSTVLNACKQIEYYLEYDKILRRNYTAILEILGFNNNEGTLFVNNHSISRVRSGVL